MNPYYSWAIALFLLFSLSLSCSSSSHPTSLLGTYSIKENGSLKEFIRISQEGEGYTIAEKQSGRWGSAKKVTAVSKEQLNNLLKGSIDVPFTGLGNKSVAIIKVPEGWSNGKFQCNTGYWLATFLGPLELHKN